MKIFLISSIIVSLVFSSGLLSAQGLILGYPLEFWESADIILDGVVISTKPIETDKLVRHDIRVEQYFKNPKSQKMIIAYGPDAYNEDWFYPKFFMEGERALFYLKRIDDKYIILEHSIASTEKCDPRDMIGLSTLPGEPIGRGGPTLFFDPYQTCNDYLYSAEYLASSLTPLKQLEAGIKIEDIKCKEGFVVATKSSSDNPACVRQSSLISLMLRGWAKTSNFEITEGFFEHKIENGKIVSIRVDPQECGYVQIKIQPQNDGKIIISIPKKIFDLKTTDRLDLGFVVLIDGKEREFEESNNENQRTLEIMFEEGSKTIEVAKSCLI